MSDDLGTLYQEATNVVTKASFFLNLFRPTTGAGDNPAGNVTLTSLLHGSTVQQLLINQLKDPQQTVPSSLKLVFANPLSSVLSTDLPASFLQFFGTVASLPFKLIKDVITGSDPIAELQDLPQQLSGSLSNLAAPLAHLPMLLINQLEVALSVLPTLQMLKQSGAALTHIDEAVGQYFFAGGFTTIDGDKIAPPQLTDVASNDLKTLKSLASQKSGADYIRNAVRLPIEAGTDVEYDLPNRLNNAPIQVFGNNPTAAEKQKVLTWMKGYAAQAEAAATTTVEGVVLGAGPSKTNSLIGAAAGSAAGTMARKAAQHVFLRELGI